MGQGREPGDQIAGFDIRVITETEHLLVAVQDQRGAFVLAQFAHWLAHGPGAGLYLELHQITITGGGQRDGLFGFGGGRHRHFQFARYIAQAGALAEQGNQHHHQGDIEQQVGLLHSGQQREHRQDNGHRAAQAGPGDKGFLAPGKTEWQQAHPHGDGARQQHQEGGDRQRPGQVFGESGGRHQQAKDQEHAGLGQPGHGIHCLEHVITGTATAISRHQAGEIDGQKAGATHQVGEGKHHGATTTQQQGMQAFVAAHP